MRVRRARGLARSTQSRDGARAAAPAGQRLIILVHLCFCLIPHTHPAPSRPRKTLAQMASMLTRPTAAFSLVRPLSLAFLAPSLRLALLPASPSSTLTLVPSSNTIIPPLPQSLLDLLPPWLLAVPKSKTSHSKKSMRSSNKGLKEQQGTFTTRLFVRPGLPGPAQRVARLSWSCLGPAEAERVQRADARLPRAGIVACPSCGAAKKAHYLCHSCHVDFRQVIHREVKERVAGAEVVRN